MSGDNISPRTISSAASSPLPVIPPIITCNKDREFLINLNEGIDEEMQQIDPENKDQKYTVYKNAFEKVIDHVDAYKPLLSAMKAEYEECVETIKRGRQEAFYLNGKLKAMTSESSTIYNYRKRGDELDHKISIIEEDNERLRRQLAELRAARAENDRESRNRNEIKDTSPKPPVKRDPRRIPGLTLQQSTDVAVLRKELEKLERQLKELNFAHRTRYSPAQVKDHLKSQLEHKVALRDQLSEQLEMMKVKRYKLKIAVEAAQAYLKIQPPHQTIGDAVVTALIRANNQMADKTGGEDGVRGTPSTTFEDDDPTREKEAEMMLEYIEKFNELLEDNLVEEAALHAANSPKGILRTPETLNRFKDMTFRTSEGRAPFLAFCEALMATVPAHGMKPNEAMSLECVKCVLEENRLDLLVHWISQDRLSLTEQLGKTLHQWCELHPNVSKRYLPLAQTVYKAVRAHVAAVVCMLQQGRVHQAVDYAKNKARFEVEDYKAVLYQCPSPDFIHAIFPDNQRAVLTMGVLVTTLLKTDVFHVGLNIVKGLHQKSKESGQNLLSEAVYADDVTSQEEWREISVRLQDQGEAEGALHLLASVTTATATKGAMAAMKTIREEELAEEKRKQQEAFEAKEKLQLGGKKSRSKKTRHVDSINDGGTSGETLQLQKKVKKVAISNQVEVQESDGAMGVEDVKSASSGKEGSSVNEGCKEEAGTGVGTGAGVGAGKDAGAGAGGSSEMTLGIDMTESSALDSSFLEDRSRSEGDSDYHAGTSGETSEAVSEMATRQMRMKKRGVKNPVASSSVTEATSEGYDADVE